MSRTDVVVVGGGPAGAVVAALLAAADAAVVLVDDGRAPWRAVGQQLAPSALNVLRRLGVERRLAAVSMPVQEARSAWADHELDHRPALLNPYGPALAVDRTALDALLRTAAREAGARVVHGHARAAGDPVGRVGSRVDGGVDGRRLAGVPGLTGPVPVVVDATGAARGLTRGRLGWLGVDRLRCTVWQARSARAGRQPWSLVESTADGWWYSAPAAGSERLTVMQVRELGDTSRAQSPTLPPRTAERLAALPLPRPAAHRLAVVGCADPPWGPGLVAVGDAALSVDPLSSSGLRHALELAEPAAEAVLGLLTGDDRPAVRYTGLVRAAFVRHLADRQYVHAAAVRYRDESFWRQRAGDSGAFAAL
ncbi:NAD(P)/FAD-dependent oxidoreductase [Saccharothrix sp. ST-888]|uniref:NAD(P)/FAD-dependent oxidoreductase n=1 Tax=Saccharothrix sp. ST-888 TaxID=1427391 RepID=UPI0005ECD39D|nr:tryptophan 7-halogenase [Saccharothrix sp. ST-888]KJK60038.1 hypothetical protein UK12_00975 [Saccharothrix sp. ST-888]